jgi:cell division protein FtsW
MKMTQDRRMDVPLLAATLALLFLGLVMVYSSSSFMAEQRYESQYYFLKRQAGAILMGLLVMAGVARVNYRRIERLATPLLFCSIALLVAVLIPGIGAKIGGARRWLHGPGFSFQPAEIAKIAIIIYAASLMGRNSDRVRESIVVIIPIVVIGGLVGLLMLGQPDFGSAAMVMALVVIMLFVAGMKLRYLGYGVLAALPVMVTLIASSAYRRTRILAFLDPWESRTGTGYQIVQSFLAFGAGG